MTKLAADKSTLLVGDDDVNRIDHIGQSAAAVDVAVAAFWSYQIRAGMQVRTLTQR